MFAILIGLPVLGIDGLAFAGALGAMFMVFGLAHGDGSWTQTRCCSPASSSPPAAARWLR
jgi:iron complex transport system permease protein